MASVYIALGSNVGDKLRNFQEAIALLKNDLTITKASAIYETAPMYVENQPPFYNAAIEAQTHLSPITLLNLLKRTEQQVGRRQRERYGPREVDLDLIAYGVLQYRYLSNNQLVLQLPHPRTGERRFVLQPLADLDAKLKLPSIGEIAQLLQETKDQEMDIRRIDAVLSI
jgi:2-amino-4-hydroxy-6-hydroxymethyldihydropteridine diphosphokinase